MTTQDRGFRVLDPVAAVAEAPKRKLRNVPQSLRGARFGFVWGQHVSTTVFWPLFEEVVEAMYAPSSVVRLYKPSTWNPASPEALDDVLRRVDVAIAGVGG
jgi:hypothetical protein